MANAQEDPLQSAEYLTAVRFVGLGWLVGFMPHGTKHGGPGTAGLDSFTDDVAKLLAWRIAMKGPCNIALVPPKGSMIMDVDLYKIEGLDRELAEAKVKKFIDETKCSASKTANGGIHLLVQDPGEGIANHGTVRALFGAPGEVRRREGTHRGYVIGPGSMVNGKRYTEIKGHEFDRRAAPALPAGVLRPAAVPAVGNAAAQDFDPVQQQAPERVVIPVLDLRNALGLIPADDYHVWLRVGFALQYDYGDDGFAYWDWWSQKSSKYPGEQALKQKWHSFGKNPNVTPVTSDTIAYIAREFGYGRASAQQDFGRGWMVRYAVRRTLEADPPAHDWALMGMLLKGKVAMLAGAGGSGKSMLMYKLGAHYALKVPHVLGRPDLTLFDPPNEPGKVLIFSAEDDEDDVHRRMYATAEAMMVLADKDKRDALGERMAVFPVGGLDCRLVDNKGKPTDFADRIIEEVLADGQVGLVMLDPSIFFSGIDDNSAEQVAGYMRVLTGIAKKTGTGVLAVTHTNKSSYVEADVHAGNVRGSTAFVDLARSAIVMRPMTREEAPIYRVDDEERWRYVGLNVVKNNYAPQVGEPVWMQRGPGGVLHAPNPPITRMAAAQARAVRQQQVAEERVERDVQVRMRKTERSCHALLGDIVQHAQSKVGERAVRVAMSERTVFNLLPVLLERKLITITVQANAQTPHKYAITAAGRLFLQAEEGGQEAQPKKGKGR